MVITKSFNLDINTPWKAPTLYIKQGDVDSRKLQATIRKDGTNYSIPGDVFATFRMHKPDDTFVTQDCTISGSIVSVVMDAQCATAAGHGKAEFVLQTASEVVSTFLLAIEILPSAVSDGDIESRDALGEYRTILEEMLRVKGAPLVANTAADMTDTDRVYVYTGSEVGYVNGSWYYYDGDSWEVGGVYNAVAVQTDKTLSILDMAADARALNFLNDYKGSRAWGGSWVRGSISSSSGENVTSTTRIRSYNYTEATVPAGMKFAVYEYSSSSASSYIGPILSAWRTGTQTFYPTVGYYYRLCAAYTDDSAITADAAENITITQGTHNALDNLHYMGSLLTSTDDLDDITGTVFSRWNSTSVPANAPANNGGTVIQLRVASSTIGCQIVVTQTPAVYVRWRTTTAWGNWVQLATV